MARCFSGFLVSLLLVAIASAPARAATMRAFVTSTGCSGDLGACTPEVGDEGVEAANNFCQARAAAAGLDAGGAIFRAWLSDSTADAYCNVLGLAGQRSGAPACGVVALPEAGPWELLDGVPFAASIDDLVTVGPITPLLVDEIGSVAPFVGFFSGSTLIGEHGTADCSGWTDDGSGGSFVSSGNCDVLSLTWAAGGQTTCHGPLRLACVEVGAGDPLIYPSGAGALAFVTTEVGSGDLATWPSSGGIDGLAGGDAICQALAAAAGLPFPPSFVAFLSDGSTDAEARLTIDGPWKRVDNVQVSDSKLDLLNGTLDTALAYDEAGDRFQTDYAWTGSLTNGSSGATHCSAWSSDAPAETGVAGWPWRSANNWTGATSPNCNLQLHLFCFSNQVLLGWDNFERGGFDRWAATVGAL